MKQEEHDHRADDEHLLQQLMPQRRHGAVDQLRAVVGHHHLDAGRQRSFHFRQPPLEPVDHSQCVLALPHDDDATDDLTLPVELGQPATLLRPEVHHTQVTQRHRHSAGTELDRNALEVRDTADVTAAAHRVLMLGHLEDAATDLVVRAPDRLGHGSDRHVVGDQSVRVEVDLVLADEASDRGDFGDAVDTLQPVPERPVLEGSELGQVVPAGRIDQGIFEDPADGGGIRTQRRVQALGKPGADGRQVLEDPAPCPVEVDTLLEHDVDERVSQHRQPADVLDAWRGAEGRDDGIRDLILDEVGAPAGPFRRNDHLCVRQIRDGIERRVEHAVDAETGRDQHPGQGQDAVAGAPGDEALDHGSALPFLGGGLELALGRHQEVARGHDDFSRLDPGEHLVVVAGARSEAHLARR